MSFFPHLQYAGDLFLQNSTQPPRAMQNRLSRTDCIKTRAWQHLQSRFTLERHPTRNSIRTACLLSCSSALRLRTAAPRPTCSTPPPRTRRRTAAGGAPDALYGFTAFEDDGFSAMSWSRASRLTPDTHACLSAQAAPVASRLPGSWPSHRVTVGRVKIDAGYGRYPTFTRHEQLCL